MHVADSHRSGNRSLDDFVAASSERSDDEILDTEDDDLHLANVSNDQVAVGHQTANEPQAALVSQMEEPASRDDRRDAFDIILQGIVQALQGVLGSSHVEIKKHIDTQYEGVSNSFLRSGTDIKSALARLVSGGIIKVVAGSPPKGFHKKRYTPTSKAAPPSAQEITKILVWADKLAMQSSKVRKRDADDKWRLKAADAVTMHCLHELKGRGGADLMHLTANIKVLTSGQMGTFLKSRSDLDAHVERLVEAGQLERRYWYPPNTSQQHRSCTTKLRCPNHIPLAQLTTAYAEFNTDEVPRLLTVAALSHDSSNDSAPHQAAQADQPSAPQHRQTTAAGPSQSDVHISASAAAVTGMAPPAYAAQTDGPIRPSVVSALADAAPSGLDEPTHLSHQAAQGLQERGDKREAASPLSDAAPAKRAKPAAEVVLHGLPLLVEEDRGPAAARDPLSKLPTTEPPLPHTQQDGSQLGSIQVDAMQVHDADSAQMPTETSVPEQLSGAATDALQQVEPVQQAQHPWQQAQHPWQQAQQGPPTQHAQRASVPSSLHWGLFPAQGQVIMQASQQPAAALPLPPPPSACLDPQQHQPEAIEEMPEQAVPRNVTWMQLHSAAGPGHGQGSLGQPQGPDCFRPSGAVWTEAGALPPALAQQDPNTGHWIPTLLPLNPFVNHQLAKTDRAETAQPQSPHEGYLATAHPHSPSASATKKRPRKPKQPPPSLQPDAPVPARALDCLELHRMHEGTPAQLASLLHPPNYPAAGNTTVTMHQSGNSAALGSTYHQHGASNGQQWHSQAQASGCTPLLPTHAGPTHNPLSPLAPGGVIDLCSPPAPQWLLRQQNGGGAEAQESAHGKLWHYSGGGAEAQESAHSQLWHYGRQPTAEPAAAPQLATSRLHKELTDFAVMATATQAEQQCIDTAVESVRRVVSVLWPQSRTVLFGSQATGLALPGSDLDIVVLGVSDNMTDAAAGFSRHQRNCLGDLLEILLDALETAALLKSKAKAKIIDAKVPIIKCTLDFGTGLAADISLGAVNGAVTVKFVRQMVAAAPPLRVLVLVIKALLKETMLNEVYTGGLSSYSIVNMAMVHLLCMGYQLPNLPGPVGNGPGFWGSLVPPPEQPEEDLGGLLLSFFDHFGSSFNYALNAVSVGQGGVVMKKKQWKQASRPWLLAVEDPQQLGRDIGSATFNIHNVQHLFAAAAATLRDCAELQTEDRQWASVQADGASSSTDAISWQFRFPVLSELIVVDTAIGRDAASCRKRQQQAKQAPHSSKLSVLDTHKLLKEHLRALPSPPSPIPPSFHVGRKSKKGKKSTVSLQCQALTKTQKKEAKTQKKKAKTARAKARLARPQTRSQDAGLAAVPTPHAPSKKKKKGKAAAQPAAHGAPPAIPLSRKQKKEKNKQSNKLSGQAGASSGGVQKKKGGKFAQKSKGGKSAQKQQRASR